MIYTRQTRNFQNFVQIDLRLKFEEKIGILENFRILYKEENNPS